MNCPYCIEQIHDNAAVCRHCKRDLHLVRMLQSRIAELEAVSGTLSIEPTPLPHLENYHPYRQPGVATELLVMLLASAASALPFALGVWTDASELWGVLTLGFSPLFVGFWLGIRIPGVRWRRYIVAGFIMTIAVVLVDSINQVWIRKREYGVNELPAILFITVASVILASAGGFTGDWFDRLRRPNLPDLGRQVAQRLSRGRHQDAASEAARVEVLAKIINAVAPILTFIGAMIGAYLTYLAAIKASR